MSDLSNTPFPVRTADDTSLGRNTQAQHDWYVKRFRDAINLISYFTHEVNHLQKDGAVERRLAGQAERHEILGFDLGFGRSRIQEVGQGKLHISFEDLSWAGFSFCIKPNEIIDPTTDNHLARKIGVGIGTLETLAYFDNYFKKKEEA